MGAEDNEKASKDKGTDIKKDSEESKIGAAAESKDDSGIEKRIASLEETFHSEVNRLNDAIAAMVANGATISEGSADSGANDSEGDDDSHESESLEDMDFRV